MSNAEEHDRLERLEGLARVWGAVYFYHPALVVPDARWEQRLVAAIPAIEAAAAPADYAAALNEHLLRHLDDPYTHAAAPHAAPVLEDRAVVGAVRRAGGALWLGSGAMAGETRTDRLRALVQTIGEAGDGGLILDWRWPEQPDWEQWLIWRAVATLLIDEPVPLPAKHERIHYGWSEDASEIYHSNWFMHAGAEILQPPRSEAWPYRWAFPDLATAELRPYAGPVAIILNHVSFSFAEALLSALQAIGRVRLVLEALDQPMRSETTETLWGGVEAHLRLHRLALSEGWVAPAPERTLAAGADPVAAVAAAETLLRERPAEARRVRAFIFPVANPPGAPPPAPGLSREERLAGLLKLWIVLGGFFPHLEFAAGDRRRVVHDWGPRFERAADPGQHALALLELAATLNDSHVRVAAPDGGGLLLRHYGGFGPPLALRDADGKPAIAALHGERAAAAGARIGMVVSAIDGCPIEALAAERGALVSASTAQDRRAWALTLALVGPKDSMASLTVDDGGPPRTVMLARDREAAWDSFARTEAPIRRVEEFGYIDLDRVDSEPELVSAFNEFAAAPGLIFDMRGYPRMAAQFAVVSRLIRRAVSSGVFALPERTASLAAVGQYAGLTVRTEQWQLQNYVVEPDPEIHYGGPVVVLIDETAISAAEDFCIYMRNAGRATFVGSATTGSNGNVTHVRLPGGLAVRFTGMRVTYADGARFQNIGILPDVEARPTLAGLRAGRDEVLEAGVLTLRGLARGAAGAGGLVHPVTGV